MAKETHLCAKAREKWSLNSQVLDLLKEKKIRIYIETHTKNNNNNNQQNIKLSFPGLKGYKNNFIFVILNLHQCLENLDFIKKSSGVKETEKKKLCCYKKLIKERESKES